MDRLNCLVLLNGLFSRELASSCTQKGFLPEEVVSGGTVLWRDLGCSQKAAALLGKRIREGWAEKELEKCNKTGVSVIPWGAEDYPASLRRLPDPPLVLYRKGSSLVKKGVGIVGTRRCSTYGRNVAKELASRLALCGRRVLSGGARGIDTAAHEGCIEAGGNTMAVLGTGVDRIYPAANRALFEAIMEKGALLSEFPLGFPARNWTFPRRNRIIAALSSPLVVVEAPQKSGALITARLALEAGRDVWAVPGRITESLCGGSNGLIADGAYPLVDVTEFLAHVSGTQRLLDLPPDHGRNLSEEEQRVYELLGETGGRTVDNIAVDAKMSATDVLRILGILSVEGLVRHDGGGRWSAAEKAGAKTP